MKILNINLHFYPESYGGATIVAEKLAAGLCSKGHEVTNLCIGIQQGPADFNIEPSPFGQVVSLNHIDLTGASRHFSPVAGNSVAEIIDLTNPDQIIVHAAQHLGLLEILRNSEILSRTTIIAHDFFWACLQGHRTLPNGRECTFSPNSSNCAPCAYFPGLISQTYRDLRHVLDGCSKLIFPSNFIRDEYARILNCSFANAHVIQNPDLAERLAPAPMKGASSESSPVVAYLGGPGPAKGWDMVQELFELLPEIEGREVNYRLYDAGRLTGRDWYSHRDGATNIRIVSPYHWSYAGYALEDVDVLLMPSRVRESFGMAAREALSCGAKALIFPSGGLSEICYFRDVIVADESNFFEKVREALVFDGADNRPIYQNMSLESYAEAVLA